jgi:hypothetical protein
MKRVKLVGPALLVVLASVVAVPSAQAGAGFDVEETPASVSGAQEGNAVFELEGLKVSCKKATLTGSMTEPTSNLETLSVTPSYTECTASEAEATVTTTGCTYVLHAGEETEADKFSGSVDVSCTGGNAITISALKCEAKIETQSGIKTVSYTDNTAATPDKFTAAISSTKVKYNKTKDEGTCPLSGTGVNENGVLTQTETVTAKSTETEASTGVWVVDSAKLCEVNEAKCELGNTYPSGTFIEGSATNSLFKAGAEANPEITCSSSTITGKTTDLVGHPLLPATIETLSFSGCVEKGTAKACSVAPLNTPYNAWFGVSPAARRLKTFIRLRVICNEGAQKYNCDYSDYERGTIFATTGGSPATLEIPVASPMLFSKLTRAGEENCKGVLQWSVTYSLTKPKPVWFTN